MGDLIIHHQGTRDIRAEVNSNAARRTLPTKLWKNGRDRLQLLAKAQSLSDLAAIPGLKLELLRGDRAGQHSIRINEKYRVCFIWNPLTGATHVEICDYH
jgi:proteic killer suppression protein